MTFVFVTLPSFLLVPQGWDVYERTRFDGECRGRRDGNRGDGGGGGNPFFNNRDSYLDCYDRYREGVNFAIHAVTFQRAVQDVRECAAECDRMRDTPARGADGCFAFAFRRSVV